MDDKNENMIKVKNLAKKYNNFEALRGVSFEIKKGEIVGFLGPNGAGKTTTMRILTGYMPMTAGEATVDGLDVFEDSLKVRQKIGYLPETTALYMDMTVAEYLRFMAELKKVPRQDIKKEIDSACGKCGLEKVKDVIIKTLSKGYKQRVGIAQAILGNPDVVILDEPTIGLDPNQIVEIRNLIKELGKTTTVILSTHILQEVSATCDKVIIINEGRIVAVDTPENLTNSMSGGMRVTIAVRGKEEDVLECLNGLDDVEKATKLSAKKGVVLVDVDAKKDADPRETIAAAIVRNEWGLLSMEKKSVDLEQIFMKLTGDENNE